MSFLLPFITPEALGFDPASGPYGLKVIAEYPTKKLTEELRFSVPLHERVHLLLGAFYGDEMSNGNRQWDYMTAADGTHLATLSDMKIPVTYTESAVFSNVTLQASDRFDVQLGARQS